MIGSTAAATRRSRGLFGLACLCVLGLAAFLATGAPTVSAAVKFPGQGFLPDNRAWEMVSPPDKNGGDVLVSSPRTRAAANGMAIQFSSLVAFGDAVGTTISSEYIARRGPDAWSTHSITLQQDYLNGILIVTGPGDPTYLGEFSDDLSRGVVRANSLPDQDPDTAGVQNLFVRTDLLTPGFGDLDLLTDSVAPIPPYEAGTEGAYKPFFAAASEDFDHVIFESTLNLTQDTIDASLPDGPSDRKLYEWDGGTLRSVGYLPAAEGGGLVPAFAGRGASGTSSFYTDDTISADGSRIFFTDSATGHLYVRENAATSMRINASEKDPPDASLPATFRGATPNGSRVLFTSAESLVGSDANATVDLYASDLDAPEGARLTLLSIDGEPDDGSTFDVLGVIGLSQNGDRVYFVARGSQLVDGAPNISGSTPAIYVWDNGALSYVGKLDSSNPFDVNTNANPLWNDASTARTAVVSPDGSRLLFATYEGDQVEPHDHGSCSGPPGPCRELYLYDANLSSPAIPDLECVSCLPTGGPATTHDTFVVHTGTGGTVSAAHVGHPLTDDGRFAFFHSAQALVPEDRNTVHDVYRYDIQAQELRLLSSGRPTSADAYFLDASRDGSDAFFATRDRLSGWDVDNSYDVYDARVGGGLPEPPAPPPGCQGDACQPAPAVLNDLTPGTASVHGPGDPNGRKATRRKRCPKGKRRVKARGGWTRCRGRGKGKRRNRANTPRRASR